MYHDDTRARLSKRRYMENLLYIKVHSANIYDTIAGKDIFYQTFKKYPSI